MTTHSSLPSPLSHVETAWRPSALLPRIAVRIAGLVGLDLAVSAAAARDAFGTDPVGVGLQAMMIMPLVAATWGAVDGYRYRHRFGLVAVAWLVAAPVAALVMQLSRSIESRAADPTYDLPQVLADLASGVPFFTGLVLVPGLLATACLAAATRSWR